jgi:hypothetical protein
MFSINLGQLTMERELIVADIEDDALLGLDILMKHRTLNINTITSSQLSTDNI